MAKRTMRYEFKPFDGAQIETGHSIASLCRCVAEPRGLTEQEVQRVIVADVAQVIHIRGVGDFRRTQ
jgi:hypothetical protein